MSFTDIKSSYFIIILFSHLNEERKLRIIKNNKNIQNLLNINIINYKIFNGKYIKYESNGKTKEYDRYNDCLIYEGEYINGKRKEFFSSKELKFEGEYLNGKRNGKGKEYFQTKKFIIKDEYLYEQSLDKKG